MLDPRLLEILCCPETKQDVSPAPDALVDRLNDAVAEGKLLNRAGRVGYEPSQTLSPDQSEIADVPENRHL